MSHEQNFRPGKFRADTFDAVLVIACVTVTKRPDKNKLEVENLMVPEVQSIGG